MKIEEKDIVSLNINIRKELLKEFETKLNSDPNFETKRAFWFAKIDEFQDNYQLTKKSKEEKLLLYINMLRTQRDKFKIILEDNSNDFESRRDILLSIIIKYIEEPIKI